MQQLARSAPQMDSAPDLKLYVAGQEKELQRTQAVVGAGVVVAVVVVAVVVGRGRGRCFRRFLRRFRRVRRVVVGVVVSVVVGHTWTQLFSCLVPAHCG